MPPTPITERSVNPPTESPTHLAASNCSSRVLPSVSTVGSSNRSSERTSARTQGSVVRERIAASRASSGRRRTNSNSSSVERCCSGVGVA